MREEVLKGVTRRVKTGCGNLYITINEEGGKFTEVFIRLGKAGGCAASQSEALGRLITLALRAGVGLETLVKQLAGIGCHQPHGFGETKVLSCADAVARCLGKVSKRSDKGDKGEKGETPTPPKPKREVHETQEAGVVVPLEKIEEVPKFNHDKTFAEVARLMAETPKFAITPCPDCGARLAIEEGCEKCHICGYTKCG